MTNYTFEDIIKILPLTADDRRDLTNMGGYSADRQNELKNICWEAFDEMTDDLADLKLEKLLAEAEEGKVAVTGDMQDQALELVHTDYEEILSGRKQEVEQIEEIRNKLQGLIHQP